MTNHVIVQILEQINALENEVLIYLFFVLFCFCYKEAFGLKRGRWLEGAPSWRNVRRTRLELEFELGRRLP